MHNRAMQYVPSFGHTLVTAAADWWRRWLDQREMEDFVRLDPEDAGRVARDFQMDVSTLLDVTRHGKEGLKLLESRAHYCGVDLGILNETHPEVARDLARCCSLCPSKSRCARDLRKDPGNEVWQSYCPNRETFAAFCKSSVAT